MKKKYIGLVGAALCVTLFTSAALADNTVKVWVNQHLLKSDVTPRMVEGKVMVSVRELAESLGATVEWDQEKHEVKVDMPQTGSLQQQIRMLELAVAAKTAEEAVQTWAKAFQTRNGALQYAIFSPSLKELERDSFEATNWVTGTSSPWVEQYKIHPGQENADGSWTFEVQLDYRTSVDIDQPDRWDEIPSFPVVVPKYDDFWYVSQFPTD